MKDITVKNEILLIRNCEMTSLLAEIKHVNLNL